MSLYLVESVHTKTSTVIKEFHRTKDGKSEIKTIENFKPYFYCDEAVPIEKYEGVLRTEKGFTSIDGTPVKKVVVQRSNFVRPIRDAISGMGYNHWEADILFHNRYTIDLPSDIESTNLKVCWFDIEVASPDPKKEEHPDFETANQPVCSIAARIGDDRTTWLWGKTKLEGTRCFDSEYDLLDDFLNYIWKESPDIISAWNLLGFDLPYLIKRCKINAVDEKRLSKIKEIWEKRDFDSGKVIYKLYGTVTLDALDAYRLWRKYGNMPILESYSLDHVAKTVLGKTKLKHGKSITWLWHNDVKTLIEYNMLDSDLIFEIDKQCKVVEFFDELRRKCRVQFDDVYETTHMLDGYLISRLNKSIILPTKKRTDGEKFDGAYVFEPVPGVYDNVLCLDIASMYPSIIKNFNISYETIGGGEIELPLSPPISFSKKKGVIPMFLDELKLERKAYKKKMDACEEGSPEFQLYYQRQYGTKIIMNSFFGYLGYPGARLYKKEVAGAITGMGQYIIKAIAAWVEGRGNRVIYGDTDSVYVTSKETDPFKAVMEGMEIRDHINSKLKEMCEALAGEHHIFIEFEKALERVLFIEAKKRYAYTLLWNDKDKFSVKKTIRAQGFDLKRSDSNKVSKLSQMKVIEMILKKATKRDIVDYLKEMNNKMKRREFTDEEIGLPKGITQPLEAYDPPSALIKGAKWSNENLGTQFGKGSKPRFIYIKRYKGKEPIIKMRVGGVMKTYKLETIAYENTIPEGFDIDWEAMTEKTFEKKLNKIFEAVGWGWEELAPKNKSLFEA